MNGVDDVVHAAHQRKLFSGAAWSFGTADGPIGDGTLGTLSVDGPDVERDTWWDLASLTKPIVGLAVMGLVESGVLTLDDTVGQHLPSFASSDKADITVRDLMCHTSGIPGQVPLYRWANDPGALVDAIRDLPRAAASGERVIYSSQGFIVLGLLAEVVAGARLDELVDDLVCVPLGLTRTRFGLPPADRARAAATELCPWRGELVQGTVHDENAAVLGGVCGHAGLFAPLDDVVTLAAALCRHAGGQSARFLSDATLRTMIEPATDHLALRRTLAWQGHDRAGSPAGDLAGPRTFGHTGFTGTSLFVDPDVGGYVVLLTNRVHPSRETVGFDRVRRVVHSVGWAALSP